MNLRTVIIGLCALGLGAPAHAEGLSPWGMWSDGAQLKKSSQESSFLPPAKLGASGALAQGGAKPAIAPQAPAVVKFDADYPAGTVIIDTAGRKLYYTLPNGQAYMYPVAVGKAGFTWTGTEKVSKIVDWPEWIPPEEMRQRKPYLPVKMTGGLNNPLGAKAIYLGNSLYRIHGTNDSSSIGTAASSGCIRMHNANVVHLASLVSPGTTVHVVRSLPKSAVGAKKPQDI